MRDEVAKTVDVDTRFPQWPFPRLTGHAVMYEYSMLFGNDFAGVLDVLAGHFGDEQVTFVTLEPELSYFTEFYSFWPAVALPSVGLMGSYSEAFLYEPNANPTGSLFFAPDCFAISGSSGQWGVFAQRDWEFGLLLTPEPSGPWLDVWDAWMPLDMELTDFRSPEGWGMKLSEEEVQKFRENCQKYGRG